MQEKPKRLHGVNIRTYREKVSSPVLDAFKGYGQTVTARRNRFAVSRSVSLEQLIIESPRAGIFS